MSGTRKHSCALEDILIAGVEPVDCEVVIPVNIIPQVPEEAVQRALEQFRSQ